jgi:phosphoglycerate dehydrogenase-like enzyme
VNNAVAIEPKAFAEYVAAAELGGATVLPLSSQVEALIWTDYHAPEKLAQTLAENPQLRWVQLPFAGVDAFAEIIQKSAAESLSSVAPVLTFTSAKGCYREPVAEHALALTLALCRALPERVFSKTWGRQFAVSLYESRVLIFGGGGITEELLNLLAPFNTNVTVVRKHPQKHLPGATETVGFDSLDEHLKHADVVILAAALTPETIGLFDEKRIALMKKTAYLINIARGPMIVTSALEKALVAGTIAGAAIDVTDPEPLPDGHPLWSAPNIIITPHTADTRPMVVRLFSKRIRENVEAFFTAAPLVGIVDVQLGY